MGETTDQLERYIENKRQELRANLQDLEARAKLAVDWRHFVRSHTVATVAVGCAVGMLVARLVGKK